MSRCSLNTVLLLCVLTLPPTLSAAETPATELLLNKARSLQGRGRLDLAAQTWRQILMSSPNNAEALAGLGRYAKQSGKTEEANYYVERLKKADPSHPGISAVESTKVLDQQRPRLEQAARLAERQQYEEAMKIYREVLGDTPAPGGWAIAYYETEAALPTGWEHATSGLQQLVEKYPQSPEYQVSLGRLLTYHAGSRYAGMRMLESVKGPSAVVHKAREAWRQALMWEGANPAALPSLKAYLARYSDEDLRKTEQRIESQGRREESAGVNPARGHEEQVAYEALKAGNLKEAEQRFEGLAHAAAPTAGGLLGLGYVKMKQNDFAAALTLFEQAKVAGAAGKSVNEAIETARFWKTVQDGTQSAKEGHLAEAAVAYQQALTMRPNSPEALQGMAGLYVQRGDMAAAAPLLERLTKLQPRNEEAWRELVNVKYRTGGASSALNTIREMPTAVSAQLDGVVEYHVQMATIYAEAKQPAEAQKHAQTALSLASAGSNGTDVDMQIRLTSLALQTGQTAQAITTFQQLATSYPDRPEAWEGLLQALVQSHEENRAGVVLSKMPDSVYQTALNRPGFLRTMASVNASLGHYNTAESLLQQARGKEAADSAGHFYSDLQLAHVWLQSQRPEPAIQLLRDLIETHSNDADLWKSLIAGLHQQGRDMDASAEIQKIPAALATRLLNDEDYTALLASVHSGAGNTEEALRMVRAALSQFELGRRPVPADLDIQFAWLLIDTQGSERELYVVLDRLRNRSGLKPDEKQRVGELWATWSLRSAEAAANAGHLDRAVSILQAAQRLLPQDPSVRRALAGSAMRAGNYQQAIAVYKEWGLAGGDTADYAGAIGSAMATRDLAIAEAWLQTALTKWPGDARLLNLGGKVALQRGDTKRAEAYWRAALTAMPSGVDTNIYRTGRERISPRPALTPTDAARELGQILLGNNPPASNSVVASQDVFGQPTSRRLEAVTPSAPLRTSKIQYFTEGSGDTTRPIGLADRPAPRGQIGPAQGDAPENPLYAAGRSVIGGWPAALVLPNGKSPVGPVVSAPRTPAEEIQAQLSAIEGHDAPYLSTTGSVQARSGEPGFEKMIVQEVNMEASTTIGNAMRLSLIARPITIETAAADGQSEKRFGLMPSGSAFAAQNATGIGAEAQLSTRTFGLRVGATPHGFLVNNIIGGLRFRPGNGPITVMLERDSVKDSLLSYAGVQDPVSKSVWGGVIANSASVQGNWGDARSGFYTVLGYQMITGKQVEENKRMDASVGTYWKVLNLPEGALTVGLNLSGMHYDKNLRYFTVGQGGYFSPQRYFLLNVPVHFNGTYRRQFQYSVSGSLGSQHFQEDASPYFPTLPTLQGRNGPYYSALTSTGLNYSLEAKGTYQISPNWYAGGFLSVNNARYYSSTTAGMFVKYSFRPQPMMENSQASSIPDWKGQQPFRLF